MSEVAPKRKGKIWTPGSRAKVSGRVKAKWKETAYRTLVISRMKAAFADPTFKDEWMRKQSAARGFIKGGIPSHLRSYNRKLRESGMGWAERRSLILAAASPSAAESHT